MTPYDTARTLHRAVMKKLTYQSPPLHGDAVNVLQDGVADCGGFTALLTACLRNVGIPARSICGFWQGDSAWHVRTEFHLPGVEWLMADPTVGNGIDPTGTYAYDFGYVPDANNYLAVDVGTSHLLLNNNFGGIQTPNFGGLAVPAFNSDTAVSYLQPNGVMSMTNLRQRHLSILSERYAKRRHCCNPDFDQFDCLVTSRYQFSEWEYDQLFISQHKRTSQILSCKCNSVASLKIHSI